MIAENLWVKKLVPSIEKGLKKFDKNISVFSHRKLAYAGEISVYKNKIPGSTDYQYYETDISIYDNTTEGLIPRVVVECKLGSITTHDAITYSSKANSHKAIHPYLRYGILVGDREHYAIPGRLFRHGPHFDFMVTWILDKPNAKDWKNFVNLLWKKLNLLVRFRRYLQQADYLNVKNIQLSTVR